MKRNLPYQYSIELVVLSASISLYNSGITFVCMIAACIITPIQSS